jgi:signal transduction protein with GAF and PtsI domain
VPSLLRLDMSPKSGKATRSDIKDFTSKNMREAEKELKKLHTELDKLINVSKKRGDSLSAKAQKELSNLVSKAKVSKEKTREVISAIHEGDAADKDLQNAVDDAKLAIKHLKDYLKK